MTNAAIGLNNYATGQNSRYPELWRGCVGAWAMCLGPTGTRLFDFSGRQNWGTLTNMDAATDWVVSGGRYALDFDGVNDYVSCSGISLPQDQSYTACCFVTMPNVTDVERRAFFSTAGSPATFTVSLEWGNDGINGRNNKFQTFTETTVDPQNTFATSTTSAVANTWYHVLSRVDTANDTISIFVNGILEATTSFAGKLTKAGVGFNIGTYRLADGRFMEGVMDDVRLYSRALSEPEIRLLASKRGIAYERRSRRRVNEQAAAAALNAIYATRQTQLIGGGLL